MTLTAVVGVGLAAGIALIIAMSTISAQISANDTPKRVWVAIDAMQCANVGYASPLISAGVQIYQTDYARWASEDLMFCAACGCGNGFAYYFLIAESDVTRALDNGYRLESPPA